MLAEAGAPEPALVNSAFRVVALAARRGITRLSGLVGTWTPVVMVTSEGVPVADGIELVLATIS
jgi:hypothetical protein